MSRLNVAFLRWLSAALGILMSFAASARAQTNTADIVGTVTDASGAVIPRAMVTVVNTGTQEKRSVPANDGGEYSFSLLQVGSYSVQVQAPGFKLFRVPSVTLAAGDRTRIDAQLQPGDVQQVVDVTSTTPALQTDSSTVGSLVDNAQVEDLPLNGRNYINLVQAQPGVSPGLSGSFGSGLKPDDRRQTSTYSANGQTDQANNNLIDGLDNNERLIGTLGVRPSPDAIQEVKVETGLYTAEVGRSAGGVVDLITKSGTNSLHGSVYEYFRNDVLDARNYFSLQSRKPELRQNQFGGSLGGPIRRNRTFFFSDYEGFRQVSGQTTVSTVPTLFEEQNCNAASGCNFSDVHGPIIPAFEINPIGLNYFKLYPAPNIAGATSNNFSDSPNGTQLSNLFDVRIDHHFSDKTTIFGRYSFNNVNTLLPGPLPLVNGVQPGGGTFIFTGPSTERQMHFGLELTHVFRPNLLLELKAGYLRSIISTLPSNHGLSPAEQFGFTGVNVAGIPDTFGLPSFTLGGGYASLGDSAFEPEQERDNSYQYLADLIYTRGQHSIKFGGGFIRRQAANDQSFYPRGAGFILGVFTMNPLGDLVIGQATSIQRQTSLVAPGLRTWEPSAFFQDDWRVTPALTLNLGVRYNVFTPFTANNNAISNFDFSKDLIVSPSLEGVNRSSATAGVKTYYGDVAPRIGFAYDLGHKAVVRGGFGMSFFPDNFSLQSFLKNAPFTSTFHCGIITDTRPCTGAYAGFAGNYRLGSLPVPTVDITTATDPANYAGASFLATDFNFRPSYVEQYSLGIQKDVAGNVVGASYVGNLGRRIVAYPNANQAPYAGAPTPIPSLPTTIISDGMSAGVSAYNALQLTVERRLTKGLSGNVNYTFAHNLSNVSTNGEGSANIPNGDRFSCVGPCHVNIPGTSNYTVVNSWEVYDYGNSEIDLRHRVAVTIGYQIPYGSTLTGVKGALLKGWSTNALFSYQTGLPFTVENTNPVGGTADGFTNTNDRPNVVGKINLSNPTIQHYFNTAAFQTQADGTLGNEGKNPIYSPRFTALNLSLFKTLAITEALKLELRAESFNLTNTPSFNPPDNMLGDAQFGVISSTIPGATPRQIQFAGKLLF